MRSLLLLPHGPLLYDRAINIPCASCGYFGCWVVLLNWKSIPILRNRWLSLLSALTMFPTSLCHCSWQIRKQARLIEMVGQFDREKIKTWKWRHWHLQNNSFQLHVLIGSSCMKKLQTTKTIKYNSLVLIKLVGSNLKLPFLVKIGYLP